MAIKVLQLIEVPCQFEARAFQYLARSEVSAVHNGRDLTYTVFLQMGNDFWKEARHQGFAASAALEIEFNKEWIIGQLIGDYDE